VPALDIQHTAHDGTQVIAVAGEFDLDNHTQVRDAVREALLDGPADVLLDLTGTTFIDSIALGTLIGARRRAYAVRGSLAVVLGSRQVTRVFEMTGLDKVFTTYPTLEDWQAR
jgi:anti-sigma B factor antagonist